MATPAAKKPPAKAAPAKKAAPPAATSKKAPVKAEATKKEAPKAVAPKKTMAAASTDAATATPVAAAAPAKRLASPFDAKFLDGQREALIEERAKLLGQAESLEGEAASLMEDLDPGDVQFDDESGEGDSLVVERERDLALSAQARQMIADIDAALVRIGEGTYGLSIVSGRPIPKDRLRAIPWATELVEEKVGGLGARR
jgi:RNA polymerase-binding transcription factor DksA